MPHEEYGYRSGQLLVTVAHGDVQRLTDFIQNLYWRFYLGFSSSDVQTRVNALATAGNQGGAAQLTTEARNQAQATVSLSNIASDTGYVTALYRGYFAALSRLGRLELLGLADSLPGPQRRVGWSADILSA